MQDTYCDRGCHGCEYKERINCPGCKAGPGSLEMDICDVAQCCSMKHCWSCLDCSFCGSCETLKEHQTTPTYIRTKLLSEINRKEFVKSRIALVGKWRTLFIIAALSSIALIFNSDIAAEFIPKVSYVSSYINIVCVFAYGLAVFKMNSVDDAYKVAGSCTMVSSVILLLTQLISTEVTGQILDLILIISNVGLYLYGKYKEYYAHSDMIVGLSDDISKSWRTLWIWSITVNIADILIGSLFPILLVFAMIVVAILRFACIYKTTVFLEDLQQEFGEKT